MEQPQCATFIDVSSVKNSASHKGYLVLPFFSLTVNETSIFHPLPRSEASLLRYCRYSQRLKAASWEGPWSSRCRGREHEGVTCTVTCECNSVLCRLLTADENKQPELNRELIRTAERNRLTQSFWRRCHNNEIPQGRVYTSCHERNLTGTS